MPSAGSNLSSVRSKPPLSFTGRERWPRATFGAVSEPGLRTSLRLAQRIVRVLIERAGAARMSDAELGRRSGVNVEQVKSAMTGDSWVTLYTAQRLLGVFDCELIVLEPADDPDAE